MANLTERVGTASVLTAAGDEVALAPAWAQRPVVLVLIRHFG